MTSKIRALLKQWLPPAAVRVMRRVAAGKLGGMHLEGDFSSWHEAVASSGGYDDPAILAKVAGATRAVQRGDAAYERDSVVFTKSEPSWPIVSALMWAAAMAGGRLRVVDFGGSLGTTYFQHRSVFADLNELQWGVVEQPHYVSLGRSEFEDNHLRFFNTIEECAVAVRPNAIVLGSVLQYLPRPIEILDQLSATPATVLIVDRTPFADIAEDRIAIQKVPNSIYRASYPFRILSRDRTLRALIPPWQLIAPIEAPEGEVAVRRSLKFRFEGFVLHR